MNNWELPPIACEVCGRPIAYGAQGVRLAANKIGAYTCGPTCDKAFIDAQKREREKEKSS